MNSKLLKILLLIWLWIILAVIVMRVFDIWSFAIGAVFIAIPALMLAWSERGEEANRIAHQLAIDAWRFIEEERDKVGYSFGDADDKDVLPLESEYFRIIKTSRGVSWYSKEYDIWFLHYSNITYYCDHNQNVICVVQNPHKFSLKKYLIPDRDVKELNKNSDYWE
jgi:hypothetical protein